MLENFGLRKKVKIDPKKQGLFVDGGVTPHNNPSACAVQHGDVEPIQAQLGNGAAEFDHRLARHRHLPAAAFI